MNGGYCFSLRYKLPSRAVSGHELSLSSNIISKDMPDTLAMGGVVGDVLDCFEPDTAFRVVYSRNRPLFNGVDLRPSAVSIPPRVHLGSDLRRLFAVVSRIKVQRFKRSLPSSTGSLISLPFYYFSRCWSMRTIPAPAGRRGESTCTGMHAPLLFHQARQ